MPRAVRLVRVASAVRDGWGSSSPWTVSSRSAEWVVSPPRRSACSLMCPKCSRSSQGTSLTTSSSASVTCRAQADEARGACAGRAAGWRLWRTLLHPKTVKDLSLGRQRTRSSPFSEMRRQRTKVRHSRLVSEDSTWVLLLVMALQSDRLSLVRLGILLRLSSACTNASLAFPSTWAAT